MATSAIGGFAAGLAGGLKLGQELNESEQRRKLALEQAERDKTRFKYEQEEAEDKSVRRKKVKAAEDELDKIDGLLTSAQIPVDQQPAAPTTAIAAPPVEPQPMVESGAIPTPAPAPTPRAAITPPGATPTPAQQPQQNPFLTGAEGKHKDPNMAIDKYYDMKEAALTKLFRARGEYDKAEQVPEMMRQLKENKWTQKVGASLAAMAGNAPGARDAFGRVYGMFADGYELDPTKGKFEEGKGWVGLERVSADGKRETFNLSPEQAMMLASKYKKPDEVIKFLLDRGDKARQEKREDTKVENDTTRAKAAAAEVEIKRPYYQAYAGALERRGRDEANAQQQRASVEAAARMFPLANKEFKPEELMLDQDRGKARLEKKAADERMYNKTLDLAGLNPKVDIRTLAQLARQGKVDAQEDADGRVFTMVGKTKVFLN